MEWVRAAQDDRRLSITDAFLSRVSPHGQATATYSTAFCIDVGHPDPSLIVRRHKAHLVAHAHVLPFVDFFWCQCSLALTLSKLDLYRVLAKGLARQALSMVRFMLLYI